MLMAVCPLVMAEVAAVQPEKQSLAEIVRLVETFLMAKAADMRSQVRIDVIPPDDRLDLAACAAPQVFLPTGARFQGRVTVGVRCSVPVPWTVYVQANVAVMMEYLVTALPLAAGHIIGYNDLLSITAEQTSASAGYATDAAQLVGRSVMVPLAAGTPFRLNLVRKVDVVKRGQSVRVVSSGKGFRISAKGVVQSDGVEGDAVKVKLSSGKIVTGLAHEGGIVELSQ